MTTKNNLPKQKDMTKFYLSDITYYTIHARMCKLLNSETIMVVNHSYKSPDAKSVYDRQPFMQVPVDNGIRVYHKTLQAAKDRLDDLVMSKLTKISSEVAELKVVIERLYKIKEKDLADFDTET